MTLRRVRCGTEALLRVALFAAIVIRRFFELIAVRIEVAIGTGLLVQDVNGVLAFRLMTRLALKRRMLPFQWEAALLVRLFCKSRGLETRVGVTGLAVGTHGPRGKLLVVRVFMAVGAQGMRDCLLKVVIFVALRTSELRVLAGEWEIRRAMVEVIGWRVRLPPAGGVARQASVRELRLRKRAAMRIGVAVLALGERDALVFGSGLAGHVRMALRASNVSVQSGECELRAAVIKAFRRFPLPQRVALRTGASQLILVRIFVTGCTLLGKSQVRMVHILHLDLRLRVCLDVLRHMALVTGQLRVLSF